MTNLEMLRDKIELSGLKPTELAVALGVSMPTYYKLKSGDSEFTAAMIQAATIALGLTLAERDAIFFAE